MSTLDVVVGGQFGSESKGRVTGELALKRKAEGKQVIGVRVAGPNAGHVVIDANGGRFALRQVPVAMVKDPAAIGIIAAGSEIDYQVLKDEIEDLERGGHRIRSRLLIDANATMIVQRHRDAEGGNDGLMQNRIGSTGKGIGAARAERIWRTASIARNYDKALRELGAVTPSTAEYLNDELSGGWNGGTTAVIIEGTQGYGLGLHTKYYPYVTSSDCRAIDFLAMAGISPWRVRPEDLAIWVVLRAYPIRVAGNSGELLGETSWEVLGLPEEHTTVTHKVRRVGAWDPVLAYAAVRANGGGGRDSSNIVRVALAMADQRLPALAGLTEWPADRSDVTAWALGSWLDQIEGEVDAPVACVGTGPDSTIWTEGRL